MLVAGREEISGKDQVLRRITGQWPMTPVYMASSWSNPVEEGDAVKVTSHNDKVFGSPGYQLTFSFHTGGHIKRIDQQAQPTPIVETDTIPDWVRHTVKTRWPTAPPWSSPARISMARRT